MTSTAQPGSTGGASDRETIAEIEAILREHIKCDAVGLAPALASVYLQGIPEAARAIAALRSKDREREDGARPFIQEHRVVTLRYMLERAERMQLCLYRAGMTEDVARYREEADALTWTLAALPLQPTPKGDGTDA